MDKEKLAILRLFRSENVGPRTFKTLYNIYGSAIKALEALPGLAKNGGKKREIKLQTESDALKEIEQIDKFGAKILSFLDHEYPEILKNIDDCPPVLTVRGNTSLFQERMVGLVGSRNASINGINFAGKLARDLGLCNFVTVSGLARGIDSAVHKGSIGTGTIGVIAGGIDNIYPPENKGLFEELYEKGLVVAELGFGSAPRASNFPQRNRIISGLSLGVVVVEANIKSGSLHTARFALDQNRQVFAVPGSPLDPRSSGTNYLIKNGAFLIESSRDVIENLRFSDRLQLFDVVENNFVANNINFSLDMMEAARKEVVELLGPNYVTIENIVEITRIPAPLVIRILLELELAGKLVRERGDKVALNMEVDEEIISV